MKYTTISATIISTTIMPVIRSSSLFRAPRAHSPHVGRRELNTRFPSLCMAAAMVVWGALCAPVAMAHPAPPHEPTVVHTGPRSELPPERIRDAIQAYDGWLDQVEDSNRVAGLATAIVVDDKVRYERTLGWADAQTGEKVKPDTVF